MKKERKTPPLIAAIAKKCEERNIPLPSVVKHDLGLSRSYFSALLNGSRPTEGLGRESLLKIAAFLDQPLVSVQMLAGIIQPQDFFASNMFEDQMENAFLALSRDPRWGTFSPSREEWDSLNDNMKVLVALLHHEASQQQLLNLVKVEVDLAKFQQDTPSQDLESRSPALLDEQMAQVRH